MIKLLKDELNNSIKILKSFNYEHQLEKFYSDFKIINILYLIKCHQEKFLSQLDQISLDSFVFLELEYEVDFNVDYKGYFS